MKHSGRKYVLPYQGRWLTTYDSILKQQRADGKEHLADQFMQAWDEYQRNPLRFFLAHGEGLTFLNDHESKVMLLRAPTQTGKSFHGLAWTAFNAIPCDPSWECFSEAWGDKRLVFPEWKGPETYAMASYEWSHAEINLYEKLLKILPMDELREYHPDWAPKDHSRSYRRPNWTRVPHIPLACGSKIRFQAYSQHASAFAGPTFMGWMFDEQIPEHLFDEAYERGKTNDSFRCIVTFTPHKVDGRPDTGAGTWIHKLVTGVYTKGLDYTEYVMQLDQVPDAIVSPETKEETMEKWIHGPTRTKNFKQLREGRSRVYGEFQSGEGLVYDSFDPGIHWIDPFDIPPWWNRYRAVDPGYVHPCGVLWGAMSPWGDLVLYREMYETGLVDFKIVQKIVEMSGNRLEKLDEELGEYGAVNPILREVPDTEDYRWTVMDGRTFKQPARDSTLCIGDCFQKKGLICRAASGKQNKDAVPKVRSWFEPIPGHKHILVSMGILDEVIGPDGTPLTKAPRIYAFNTLSAWRQEILGYVNKEGRDEPVDKDDHLMTAMKYMILEEPQASEWPDGYGPDGPMAGNGLGGNIGNQIAWIRSQRRK